MEKLELDQARQEKARRFARQRHYIFFGQLLLSAALWLAFLLSGASLLLREYIGGPGPATDAVFSVTVLAAYGLAISPFAYYGGFVLPRRYGILHQSLRSWSTDLAKAMALNVPLVLGAVVGVYRLIDILPDIWWLLAALVILILSLVLTAITPTLLIPLFFKLKPMEDRDLAGRLASLGSEAGVRIKDVKVMGLSAKTSAGNAMLAGLGRTRQMILGDTVLKGYSRDEIEIIVGHELAHHRNGDIGKLMAIHWAAMLAGLYLASVAIEQTASPLGLAGTADVAGLPVLLLVLAAFNTLMGPVTNWISRRLESSADRLALDLTGKPLAFYNLMTKLTNQNLAQASPARWEEVLFYDHPPYAKRIRPAEQRLAAH